MEGKLRAVAEECGHSLRPLFLPGNGPPERWLWSILSASPAEYSELLGVDAGEMAARMSELCRIAQKSVFEHRDGAKSAMEAFAQGMRRDVSGIARTVGREEAGKGSMSAFMIGLTEQIDRWRQP